MRKIILYKSKHGGSKKIAEILKEACSDFELQELKSDTDIEGYDVVVLGSSIYAGMADKDCKEFIKKHLSSSSKKRFLLYLSGISKETGNKEFEENYDADFLVNVYYKDKLGGQLNFPEFNFFEKSILKMINKKDNLFKKEDMKKCIPLFDDVAIEAFIEKMKQA